MLIHPLIETTSNFFHFIDLKRINEENIWKTSDGIKAGLNWAQIKEQPNQTGILAAASYCSFLEIILLFSDYFYWDRLELYVDCAND